MNNIPPAQLWLGAPEQLKQEVEFYLQEFLCPQKGCKKCSHCKQIAMHQYHATLWLSPEKQSYTVEQLDIIYDRLNLELDDHQHYFIIVQYADYLNASCANKLLKAIEEPPPGYHFIFLGQRRDSILPTIRSRCIVKAWHTTQDDSDHPLISFFTKQSNPADFLKELDPLKLTEQESNELLDIIFAYWINEFKREIDNSSSTSVIQKKITIFQQALENPPMPGSSKLFWKNLFLQLSNTNH